MTEERRPTRDEALAAAKRSGSLEEWQKAWKMTPDGITEQEWTYYQNMDPRQMKPEIRNKVEAALGLRQDDVTDAQEIAERVLGAVSLTQREAEREDKAEVRRMGHVPDDQLWRYRNLVRISRTLKSMGDTIGPNDMTDSTILWAMAAKYRDKANELRVDLPREEGNDDNP